MIRYLIIFMSLEAGIRAMIDSKGVEFKKEDVQVNNPHKSDYETMQEVNYEISNIKDGDEKISFMVGQTEFVVSGQTLDFIREKAQEAVEEKRDNLANLFSWTRVGKTG